MDGGVYIRDELKSAVHSWEHKYEWKILLTLERPSHF